MILIKVLVYYDLKKLVILVIDIIFYGFWLVLFYIMLEGFEKLFVFVLRIIGFSEKKYL